VTSYYPLFLNLSRRLCVIIGGGRVAERKARGLVKAGARLKIVSPKVTAGIRRLSQRGAAELIEREYREGDLEGGLLAFAATDRKEVNERVAEESARRAILLNVADSPGTCDFIVPSTIESGPVRVAVSTSGLAPTVAKKVKAEVAAALGADYGAYARRVGAFRRFLMEHVEHERRRKDILRRVDEADVPEVSRMSLKEMKKRFLGEEDE
jgi:precorrin-2 dehydrogenase / sirohydrochlorin ferrochelatase